MFTSSGQACIDFARYVNNEENVNGYIEIRARVGLRKAGLISSDSGESKEDLKTIMDEVKIIKDWKIHEKQLKSSRQKINGPKPPRPQPVTQENLVAAFSSGEEVRSSHIFECCVLTLTRKFLSSA